MFKTIDEIMYITDGHNPYRNNLIYGYGGLGYKPTIYNIIGGALSDDEDDDESSYNDFDDDMIESYLTDSIHELNKKFDTLTKEEYEQMRNYQNQLEDVIINKNNKDEQDYFTLNEIRHSRGLIDNILNNFDDKTKLIYEYDIERGFIEPVNSIEEYIEEDEEEKDLEDYKVVYEYLIKKKILTEKEKDLLNQIKKKIKYKR